jgi:hypothetical protein
MARHNLQTALLQSLWGLSKNAGQQQLPALFNAMRSSSSSSHAGLQLDRLQQAVTPQACAELSARVSKGIIHCLDGVPCQSCFPRATGTVPEAPKSLEASYAEHASYVALRRYFSTGKTRQIPYRWYAAIA